MNDALCQKNKIHQHINQACTTVEKQQCIEWIENVANREIIRGA